MANGTTPSVQVPTGSFNQGDQPNIDTSTQKLLQILSTVLKPRAQLMQTGVPAPLPQMQSTVPPNQGQGWKPAQANMYSIGSALQNAAARIKQQQFAEAESDWNDLTTSIQKYVTPDGTIDPKAYLDPAVMNVLGNPKKLKKMAKALNQDWLNPEKTDVYSEALKSHLSKQQQKAQAAQGLKGLFSKLIQGRQQPQLNQQQTQQMAQQVMSKAPIGQPAVSKEEATLLGDILKDKSAEDRQEEKEEYDSYKTEQGQKFQEFKQQNQQAFTERMDRLRQTAQDQRESQRETAMFKALGMRLSDEDKKRLSITPTQMNTEVNSTLTSMRAQLTQASTQLRTLTTQAQTSKKWYNAWQSGVGSQQLKDAQSQVDNLKASIDYIEKNRAGIISGKTQLDDVIDQAQSIAEGNPPGFN